LSLSSLKYNTYISHYLCSPYIWVSRKSRNL
jgi:hypothetical protein